MAIYFFRTLFRIESTSDGFHHLLISSTDGSSMTPFFKQEKANSFCNCTHNPLISDVIALGFTTPEFPDVYWLERDTKNIIMSDFYGCFCRIVVIASDATTISIDEGNIYWSDTTGTIHALTKTSMLENIFFDNFQNFASLANQLYPPRKCLSPKRVSLRSPSIDSNSSSSITLLLPDFERNKGCFNPIPTVKYHVFYKNYTGSESSCNDTFKIVEFSYKKVEITGLKPYKKYVFCVGVSNIYDDENRKSIILSEPAVYMTAQGGKQ